jgi:Tol biopolymer transport system component
MRLLARRGRRRLIYRTTIFARHASRKDTDGRYAVTPTWSPDGSMIMFALDPIKNPFVHPPNALYVIRADGSDLTQVLGGNNFKRKPYWVSK